MQYYHSNPPKGWRSRNGRRTFTKSQARHFDNIALAVVLGLIVIGFIVASLIERHAMLSVGAL